MATLSSTGRFAAGEACADNDILYGPYATIAAAHAVLLNAEQNVVGRTVGIQTGNTIEEYWYQGGTDIANLVKKQTEVDTSNLVTEQELAQELNGYVKKTDPPSPASGDIVVYDENGGFGNSGKKVTDFVTKSVNDLANYYLKSETYTKEEVAALIDAIQQFHYEVYTTLPQSGESNVLYLIGPTGTGKDKYEEYVYANGDFVPIGDTSIDLSGYVTTSALNTALAGYTTTESLTTLLAGKQDTINDLSTIRSGAAAGATAVQPSPTSGLLRNDGSVDTVTAGKATSALQPKQSGQYTQGNIVVFDANGGLTDSQKKTTDFATTEQGTKADNAIPMPTGTDGQILEKDSNETGGVKWVNKPSDGEDGASAYDLYEQAEIAAGRTPLSQEAWLASLKANIGAFQFITPTDTTAEAALTTIGSNYASAIGGVSPTQSTLSIILLMNDSNNTKTMMIATQEVTPATTPATYEFVYVGDLQSAMPSNVLTGEIINDLNTGGTSDVLSAEQGKVIGKYIFDHYESEDLSQVTISNYSLGAATMQSNRWMNRGQHFVYPVVPGQKIKIGVSSTEANGGFYGFFTSSYNVPSSNTSVVPYVAGTSREWLNRGTSIETTVPPGASYICCCPKDGDAHRSEWTIQTLVEAEMKDEYVQKDSSEIKSGIYEDVDMESITESNCTMLNTGWGAGKHKVVPIPNGTTNVMIRATGSTGLGNFYAFLTSSYVTPTSGSTIPYVPGTTREWVMESSGWVSLTCPINSAYLCLVTENGDHDTTRWEVKILLELPIREVVENYTLKSHDIIDNLVDGGTNKPLSAEQGKILYEKYSDGFPLGLTKHAYKGAMVKVGDTHYVSTRKVSTVTSQNFQGGACYGDYLFMFTENNTTCWIYNLAEGTLVQTITIPSEERGFVPNCHCNTVNFGIEKFNENDPFPLIYVSTGYAYEGYTGALVYRVNATLVNDVTTYSLSLVQTLKLPGSGWTEFVVGEDGSCYLFYNFSRIYKMRMPKRSEGDITFNLDEALRVYTFTAPQEWYNGSRGQNRLYHKGKIYYVSGVPASGEASLFIVLDLATETRDAEIDLYNTLGLTSEPETCFIWRNHICIAFRSNANVYALYFD